MKKVFLRTLSLTLSAMLVFSCIVCAFAADGVSYTITNPYASVTNLLGNADNHYKTNLHTHSTYSDADVTLDEMVLGYYERDFDVLAFADHGVIGVEWNKAPTMIPLYQYQKLLGLSQTHLTDEQYTGVTSGTLAGTPRTNPRGLECLTGGIELNMLVITKSHVNGYFMADGVGEGYFGYENDFEGAVKLADECGGLSHINHPGDWLESARDPSAAKDPANVKIFADIFRKYKSCLGMEILNRIDSVTRSDRILWDEELKAIIPEGERNVWGFSNSDAHVISDIDTSFMDFILPSYSSENMRTAMENGTFFSIGRRAKNEMGEGFVGTGAYPQVTGITVDDENDTITITGINCNSIEWVADGEVIKSTSEAGDDNTVTSTITLAEHSDKISCYVRAQLLGDGGICFTQAFVCDDGNMERFIIEDNRSEFQIFIDKFIAMLKGTRLYVIFELIADELK